MRNPGSTLAIHTHDRIDYRRCRRKWDLGSPLRQNLQSTEGSPNVNLWLGTGVHFALEDYHGYNRFGDPCLALEKYYEAFPPSELPDAADEALVTGIECLEYYKAWLPRRDDYRTMWLDGKPQVEVAFQVELPTLFRRSTRVVYAGTIDRICYDAHDRIWIVDYKTASIIDLMKLEMDSQISAYLWAAAFWLQRPIEGMLYVQISKNPPHPPKILSSGYPSLDKRQRTTYELYRQALLEVFPDGSFPGQYVELLNTLSAQQTPEGDQFIRMDTVRRNAWALESTYQNLIGESNEMLSPDIAVYPNFTRDCSWDCQFRSTCMMMQDGSDWKGYLAETTAPKGERDPWRRRIKWPTTGLRLL